LDKKSSDPKTLFSADQKYQDLQAEHRQLDEKIKQLSQKRYLTPEEEREKKQWQKLKLKLKDEMAEIERRYRAGSSSGTDSPHPG